MLAPRSGSNATGSGVTLIATALCALTALSNNSRMTSDCNICKMPNRRRWAVELSMEYARKSIIINLNHVLYLHKYGYVYVYTCVYIYIPVCDCI